MIDQALQDLINFIKNAAPMVWETLIRQVYNDAITYTFWALTLLVFTIILFRVGKRWEKTSEEEHDDSGICMLPYAFAVIFIIAIPILISNAIRMFVNPNFYAIKSILGMISGNN